MSLDKYKGCLVGGAIGDALGAPVEFLSLSHIISVHGKIGVTDYIEHPNNIGEFTDDTQMTLFTAEALLRAKHRAMLKGISGALPIIAQHAYLRWLHTQNVAVHKENIQQGVYDITRGWLINREELFKRRAPGNTCLSALSSGHLGTIANPINNSKGCGTIMRVAPIGLFYNHEQAFDVACELSAITHGHPTGYLSAGVFAAIISDLANNVDLLEAINRATIILKRWEQHAETLQAINQALQLFEVTKNKRDTLDFKIIEQLGEAWIAEEALSISLYCSLLFQDNFKKGVLFSINHGGDSDSTGAITGNMLGLIHGLSNIPKKWINHLKYHDIVLEMAEDLHTKIKGNSYQPNMEWKEKYPGF